MTSEDSPPPTGPGSEPSGSDSPGAPSESGTGPSVTKLDATGDGLLARLWDDRTLFTAVSGLLLVVAPTVGAVIAATLEGTFRIPGTAQGLLEASTLAQFPSIFLALYFARRAVESQYDTLRSLETKDLIRFEDGSTGRPSRGIYRDRSSTLTADEYAELVALYRWLLTAVTPRGGTVDGADLGPHRRYCRLFKRGFALVWIVGVVGLLLATYNHWFSVSVYGFDTWYSGNHPVGFTVRTAYNAMVFLVVGPSIVSQLAVLSFLLYHPFKFLNERNALRYRRFAPDGVGGYSAFGTQSLNNVLVLLPFSIIGVVYLFFLPTTRLLLVGGVLYTLAFPVLFFGPLVTARAAIRDANERELSIVARAYTENYEDYKRELAEADRVDEIDDQHLLTRHEVLQTSDNVYNEIRDRPNWPFDRSVIQRFVSLMLTLISGLVLNVLELFT